MYQTYKTVYTYYIYIYVTNSDWNEEAWSQGNYCMSPLCFFHDCQEHHYRFILSPTSPKQTILAICTCCAQKYPPPSTSNV